MNNDFKYSFQERYSLLLKKDQTDTMNTERLVLFYILAGNLDLYKKINYIYDFKDHSIKPSCLESTEVDFSSGSQKLIMLAFNLYNGFTGADILDVFSSLDYENFDLAINAIKLRFNRLGGNTVV